LKLNDDARYPDMFKREAEGLNALRDNSTILVPHVIKNGAVNGQQYLLLEWMEKGKPAKDCREKFGAALAAMHQKEQAYFGFPSDNYIGSLPQQNTRHDTWHLFYANCRILPLAKILFNNGSFDKPHMKSTEQLCNRFSELFPAELPALLHGDLWGGNYMITSSGYAAIYDPAVYYGHREMDIGMTKLFGGFDQQFYQSYQAIYPLESGWQQRLPLAQLYPLLVHAVLFGGHYISSAAATIKQFA
jgi:fructosamine-3-kinase